MYYRCLFHDDRVSARSNSRFLFLCAKETLSLVVHLFAVNPHFTYFSLLCGVFPRCVLAELAEHIHRRRNYPVERTQKVFYAPPRSPRRLNCFFFGPPALRRFTFDSLKRATAF